MIAYAETLRIPAMKKFARGQSGCVANRLLQLCTIRDDVTDIASAGTLMTCENFSTCESHWLIHGCPSGSSEVATQNG